MTRDNVELYALSNETYFEEIGPLVQKLWPFVRLGFKKEHCALPCSKPARRKGTNPASHFGMPVLTIKRWWKKCKEAGSFANRPRLGRRSCNSTVAKIVMEKSAGKSGHSAGKLSKRLTRKNYPVSEELPGTRKNAATGGAPVD